MKIFLALAVVSIFAFSAEAHKKREKCHDVCKANEAFFCGCADKVCNQPDKICITCNDGCFCADGFVRDVEGGTCIPIEKCPAPTCQDPNESYYCKCADKVCNEPEKVCKRCLDGCYCNEGFVRAYEGGPCVAEEKCPSGPNEEFNCKCADSVCNQPDKICVQCTDGFYCAEGYVRDEEGGTCIPVDDCPIVDPPPTCKDPNEILSCRCNDEVCGMAYIAVVCKKCNEGCYCDEGYIRESVGGKCVRNDQCPVVDPPPPPPKTCGENETYGCECPDPDCANPRGVQCLRCEDGCHCNPGYVRLWDACVPVEACPETPAVPF